MCKFILIILLSSISTVSFGQSKKEYFKYPVNIKYVVKPKLQNNEGCFGLIFNTNEDYMPLNMESAKWVYEFDGFKFSCYGLGWVNKSEHYITENDTVYLEVYENDSLVFNSYRTYNFNDTTKELEYTNEVLKWNHNCNMGD